LGGKFAGSWKELKLMSAETDRLQAGDLARLIQIPAGSVALEGELAVPPNAEGLVIFAHGSGSSRHSPRNHFVAQLLRKAGLGTLLFDLLTAGEGHEESAGAHLRFNIGLLTQRLACAAHWVADEDEARHLGLGFFGASTGAAAALVAAADLGKTIGAVVSRGGRPDLAGNALRRLEVPTMLIVGERDQEVLELNEEAYEMLDCEKVLTVVPRATHLFEEPGALEEVARLASEWFLEHLRPFGGARFPR
jgi:pimeloyl-ACP methyl ester carboxylesterase